MFLDNLKKYFRLRDVKEPVKQEYSSPRNEYYGRVSERFSTTQMILYVVLTIFVLISLMINSEWITYENFYYFFSDMGNYITDSDSDIEDVIYKEDRQQSFAMYGNKFGVAGNSGVKLYTSSGRLIIDDYDESKKISNPKLLASDRYLMMYDMGSNEFRIYNIFTKIFSETTEYPIYGADISNSGSFALITGEKSRISSVHLYSNKFKVQKTYNIDNAIDVSLSASGNEIAILSYSVQGGDIGTNVFVANTWADTVAVNEYFESSFPMYCQFTSSNRLLIVCDNMVLCYDSLGGLVSKNELHGKTVCADVNEYGAAVVLKDGNRYTLTVFDPSGREAYNKPLDALVENIVFCDNAVFLDQDSSINKINIRTGETVSLENSDFDTVMLAKNENELFVCLPSRVKYINFD